jgi:hypothetical protein
VVKEALWSQGVEDFVKSFQEYSKAWIVRKGCNKAGQFLELAVYAMSGRRGFNLFPDGRGGWGWNRVVAEQYEVLTFFKAASGSHLPSVLSPTENKAGKKVLGLQDFSKDSISGCPGGAWHIVGGNLSLFKKLCDLDFHPAVRYGFFVLEKLLHCPMVKAMPLCPLGKKLHERDLSDRGTSCSAKKKTARLKLRTWRKLLVKIKSLVGWVVSHLLSRFVGFRMGQNFKRFRLSWFMTKSILSSFPTIFPKYREQNHFLFP